MILGAAIVSALFIMPFFVVPVLVVPHFFMSMFIRMHFRGVAVGVLRFEEADSVGQHYAQQ